MCVARSHRGCVVGRSPEAGTARVGCRGIPRGAGAPESRESQRQEGGVVADVLERRVQGPIGALPELISRHCTRERSVRASPPLVPWPHVCASASLQNASCSISRTTGISMGVRGTRVAGRLVVKWRLPRRFKNPSPDTLRAGGPEHASRMSNPPTSPVGRWLRCVCAHVCGPPALAGGPASGMSNEHGVVPCSI